MNLPKVPYKNRRANLTKYVRNTARRLERKNSKGLLKNPVFCFGLTACVLFGAMYASCDSSANINGLNDSHFVFFNSFFNKYNNLNRDGLFSSQADAIVLESPDLKIMQDNTLVGVSTPSIVSGKVLGDVFGGNNQNKNEIVDYTVQPGDTLQSVADSYGISVNTLLLANDLTASSVIKVGQSLVVLPIDGILHIVRVGDTVSGISQTYKAQQNDVISFNSLVNQGDIYIGDILIVPGGVMPKKAIAPVTQVPVADSYFIFPTVGRVTQGLHYYNAIDVANKCGTPIYAAATGIVQRVKYGWNFGGGNLVTILHSNGVVTYYGHLMTIFVNPGDKVNVGDRIALMGGGTGTTGDGISTGCHLHFGVVGAKNSLSSYPVGSNISYK